MDKLIELISYRWPKIQNTGPFGDGPQDRKVSLSQSLLLCMHKNQKSVEINTFADVSILQPRNVIVSMSQNGYFTCIYSEWIIQC